MNPGTNALRNTQPPLPGMSLLQASVLLPGPPHFQPLSGGSTGFLGDVPSLPQLTIPAGHSGIALTNWQVCGESLLGKTASPGPLWLPNHRLRCVAPSSLEPLAPFPLPFTPDLTLPKVDHHPSLPPWPWIVPFLIEVLQSPGFCLHLWGTPNSSSSSPKPQCPWEGTQMSFPNFCHRQAISLIFIDLIIFLKSTRF